MQSNKLVSQISSATPLGLLIISYGLLLSNLERAKNEILQSSPRNATNTIIHCQNIVVTLIDGLNLQYELANEILPIYMHINSTLIQCQIKSNRNGKEIEELLIKNITQIEEIVNNLLDGINTLPDIDVPQTHQVYAGLTYDKDGNLSEYTPQEEMSQGYKA